MSDETRAGFGAASCPPETQSQAQSTAADHHMDVQAEDKMALDAVVQAHIGRELRSLFDEMVHEPVPDRFLQLLQTLEAKKGDPA